jgi:hypothetical protein
MNAYWHPRTGPSRSKMNSFTLKQIVAILSVCGLIILAPAFALAQKKKAAAAKIAITSPEISAGTKLVASEGSVPLTFTVSDPDINGIKLRISTDSDGFSRSFPLADSKGDHLMRVPLFKGTNTIELFGLKGTELDKTATAKLIVACSVMCGGPNQMAPGVAPTETPAGTARNVIISRPANGDQAKDQQTIERSIKVMKASGIKNLAIDVTNGDKNVQHLVKGLEDQFDTESYIKVSLKLLPGKNTIRAYSLETLGEKANQDVIDVTLTCTDANCGKAEGATAEGETGKKDSKITILQPTDGYPAGDVNAVDTYLSIAKDSKIKKLQYEVFQSGKRVDSGEAASIADHPDKAALITQRIKLKSGDNTIRFFDPDNPGDTSNQATIKVNCTGEKCGKADEAASRITINEPKTEGGNPYPANNISSIDAWVTVPKGDITKIQYDVMAPNQPVWSSNPITVDAHEKAVKVPVRLVFVKGLSTIRIYDVANAGGDTDASIRIDCTGENCPSDLNVATIVTNSQNTRIIVGLEQAGASSSTSQTKPFLDFFFTTPILFDQPKQSSALIPTTELDDQGNAVLENGKPRVVWIRKSIHGAERDNLVATKAFDYKGDEVRENGKPKIVWIRKAVLGAADELRVPRAGFWGDVRLASTPEQLTTTGILPSNLVNLVGKTGTAANLVQSFDFLAGLEARLFTAKGSFLSLIPGIKQKTRFYIAGGLGAISPLDAQTEAPKFLLIPGTGSSQRALFEQRYGKPPAGALQMALVPLERDRFFRQWYAGIRLKTFYCEHDTEGDPDCHRFRNSFPAIVDFMIGQNQSATGGSFRKTDTIDPATGIGKEHQAFVFRLDGFYPLPFREASFIYFYGTAIMNILGKQSIDNFLVLTSPESSLGINDPTVYVPPSKFLRALQSNRDYYKIGVGINLTDFFNRNKPKN